MGVSEQSQPERPLRIPLREVYQIGGTEGAVAVGRVETGSLSPGMQLYFMPGSVTAKVLSVEMHQKKLDKAVSGDCVNIHVSASMKEVRRGMVASSVDDHPAKECSSFLAQVIVLSPPRAGELRVGCVLTVDCHTAQVPCVFEDFLSRADRRTGKVLEEKPATLQEGDAAIVRLRPLAPLCVEPFSEYPPLGRFAVRDQKNIVGIGVVQQVCQAVSPAVRPLASPLGTTSSSRHKLSTVKEHGGHRHLRASDGLIKSKARERDLGHALGHSLLTAETSGSAKSKAKAHHHLHAVSRLGYAAKTKVPERHEIDDTDPEESSPKLIPEPNHPAAFGGLGGGASPFALFSAVRTRQQECLPPQQESPLKRHVLNGRPPRKESDASDG